MTYDLITITWNSAKTLQRTLNSVSKQRHHPQRYIFIDANSADETLEIIEKFRLVSPNIEVILKKQTGTGISQAWNQALKHCQAELICLLNSDDWWQDNCLEKAQQHFKSHPKIDILAGSINYHLDSQIKLMHSSSLKWLPFKMPIMHPACFVKKSVYDKIGGFDEACKTSMDYDWIWRAYKSNVEFKLVEETFTNMLGGGMANANKKRARIETRKIASQYGPISLAYLAYLARTILSK